MRRTPLRDHCSCSWSRIKPTTAALQNAANAVIIINFFPFQPALESLGTCADTSEKLPTFHCRLFAVKSEFILAMHSIWQFPADQCKVFSRLHVHKYIPKRGKSFAEVFYWSWRSFSTRSVYRSQVEWIWSLKEFSNKTVCVKNKAINKFLSLKSHFPFN